MSRKISKVEFGKFLKDWRERAGLTERFVAQCMDSCVANSVQAWERGDKTPQISTLEKLSDLYNAGSHLVVAWAHIV